MRGKSGSAHFEMIIGFVFFIGFVLFLFMFLNPWTSSSLPKSALGGLHDAFEEKVNVPLSSVFISANISGVVGGCFYIDLPTELFKKQVISGEDIRVTLLGGDPVVAQIAADTLILDDKKEFFRVAISPEFISGVATCGEINNNFELGGVVELDVVSYSALTDMNNSYYGDYEGLKSSLRVADIFDFAIVPEGMPEVVMKPASGIPDAVDVLAKDYIVKVLKSNGEVSNERISFRIW